MRDKNGRLFQKRRDPVIFLEIFIAFFFLDVLKYKKA